MEIPIVVAEDEVNVAGFVDAINLSVDLGPSGERGSIIFAGTDTPPLSTSVVSSVYGTINAFKAGDLYIKIGNPYYSWVYIYQDQPGGAVWAPILPLQPSLYMTKQTVAFTSGVGTTLSTPLTDIIGTDDAGSLGLTAANFIVTANVHYTTNDTNIYVVGIKGVAIDGANLEIDFNCRALSASAVTAPSASFDLNISIGVEV